MARQYQPYTPFNIPFKILSLNKVFKNGINTDEYVELDVVYYCGAKSYGGTEKVVNDVYVVEDTWDIDTYYTPNIKFKDRIKFLDDDSIYEVINTPENINRRNQFLRFKVVRVHG